MGPGMIRAQRREYETYLRSGWRRDGGSDSGVALQLKFNPNHDPQDERFTFATGGASSSGGGDAPATCPRETLVKPTPGKAVFGHPKAGSESLPLGTSIVSLPQTVRIAGSEQKTSVSL